MTVFKQEDTAVAKMCAVLGDGERSKEEYFVCLPPDFLLQRLSDDDLIDLLGYSYKP